MLIIKFHYVNILVELTETSCPISNQGHNILVFWCSDDKITFDKHFFVVLLSSITQIDMLQFKGITSERTRGLED